MDDNEIIETDGFSAFLKYWTYADAFSKINESVIAMEMFMDYVHLPVDITCR